MSHNIHKWFNKIDQVRIQQLHTICIRFTALTAKEFIDELAGVNNVMLIAQAMDGDAGPTDAAGAVVTGQTAQRAKSLGPQAADYLSRNEAYPFLMR